MITSFSASGDGALTSKTFNAVSTHRCAAALGLERRPLGLPISLGHRFGPLDNARAACARRTIIPKPTRVRKTCADFNRQRCNRQDGVSRV